MIDLMKRLQELDSKNPNVVQENQRQVDECGVMPEMSSMPMDRPSTPATINMTAGSAAELGDLLKDIVSLAGMKSNEPDMPMSLGTPAVLEPASDDMGPPEPQSGPDAMRSMIDKLNPMDKDDDADNGDADQDSEEPEEKPKQDTDETVNSMGADPNDKSEFDPNQFAHQENQPGQGDRMDGTSPKAYADVKEAFNDLFAQYKRFVAEN